MSLQAQGQSSNWILNIISNNVIIALICFAMTYFFLKLIAEWIDLNTSIFEVLSMPFKQFQNYLYKKSRLLNILVDFIFVMGSIAISGLFIKTKVFAAVFAAFIYTLLNQIILNKSISEPD